MGQIEESISPEQVIHPSARRRESANFALTGFSGFACWIFLEYPAIPHPPI
jgi:hypothetical protein